MVLVLVIDDEAALRDLTAEFLEAEGYEVLLAESGAAGLALARVRQPDVILCDIEMPGMDGRAVLKALREDVGTAALPFIFVTGRGERPDQRAGMELGADDYIGKPVAPEELSNAVQAQIRKHEERAAREERALAQLRANIATAVPHEFLTPLTVISGCAELLAGSAETLAPADVRHLASSLDRAARRLRRTLGNLVHFTQLELTASSPQRVDAFRSGRTQDAGASVARAARAVAGRWGRPDDLDLQATAASATARIEAGHLERVVEELVDNACKFSPRGSRIEVELRGEGAQVVIAVSDSGQGMTPEQIAQIGAFMQFARGSREQQGSGMGLAIVKRTAELAEGRLDFQSPPGGGTTVELWLPAA